MIDTIGTEITRQEAATLAGVGLRTIDKWVRQGKIAARRVPAREPVRVSRASLDAHLSGVPMGPVDPFASTPQVHPVSVEGGMIVANEVPAVPAPTDTQGQHDEADDIIITEDEFPVPPRAERVIDLNEDPFA